MKLSAIISTIRPKTLQVSAGPVVVGIVYALTTSFSILKLAIAIAILLCTLSLQALANVANDYFDHVDGIDTVDRIGPKRALMNAEISLKSIRKLVLFLLLCSVILGVAVALYAGWWMIAVGATSIIIAIGYTARPLQLSRRAMGEILAIIFFGPVAVLGTQYALQRTITIELAILSFGIGCIPGAVMAINNMRDRLTDAEVNKHTLATIFGEVFSRRLIVVLLFLSVVMPIYVAYKYKIPELLVVTTVLYFFRSTIHRVLSGPIDSAQNKSLGEIAKYCLVYCTVMSLALWLSHL